MHAQSETMPHIQKQINYFNFCCTWNHLFHNIHLMTAAFHKCNIDHRELKSQCKTLK